jgi:hypothetical protein
MGKEEMEQILLRVLHANIIKFYKNKRPLVYSLAA